jgi:hypothetical protein
MSVHYSVGNQIFNHKIEAVMHSIKMNEPVSWNFHKEKLKSCDWTIEPELSLDKLYEMRAQQISDSYDYVVILCSGGADSTNVLKSFVNNDIIPDEIIASMPLMGLRDYNFNDKDTSHNNTMSETVYAQIPLLKEIANLYPDIKITINDYFENILSYESEEWIYTCEQWIHPSSAARYNFEKHKHLKNLAENGKRIAFVYGIDKPKVALSSNGNIYSSLSDLTVNVARPPFNIDYPNVENVLFYYTPLIPEIMIKQAHVVAKWLFLPENKKQQSYMLDLNKPIESSYTNRAVHSKYERAIVPVLYPSTHRTIFQAEKPGNIFMGEHDNWFYKHHSKIQTYDIMINDVKRFFEKIPANQLAADNNGFITLSNHYCIGPLDKFKPYVFR